MSVATFSFESIKELVSAYFDNEVEFPVDFDNVWRWLGYFSKKDGLYLLKKHFRAGNDYVVQIGEKSAFSPGSDAHQYYLTLDCAKELCMMAGTAKAHEVRRYFIYAEKELWEVKKDLLKEKDEQQKAYEALPTGLKNYVKWQTSRNKNLLGSAKFWTTLTPWCVSKNRHFTHSDLIKLGQIVSAFYKVAYNEPPKSEREALGIPGMLQNFSPRQKAYLIPDHEPILQTALDYFIEQGKKAS